MRDYERITPFTAPIKRPDAGMVRDPYHCLPATYTEKIYDKAPETSRLFEAKIHQDRVRLGLE